MKTSTKYWIYALVINPITTLIIYYMFNAGFNLLNPVSYTHLTLPTTSRV